MVGILLSYWGGLFSGATLVLGRVIPINGLMLMRSVWGNHHFQGLLLLVSGRVPTHFLQELNVVVGPSFGSTCQFDVYQKNDQKTIGYRNKNELLNREKK